MSQPTVDRYPLGAIRSIAQLQSILDEGNEIELFYVHGLGRMSSLGGEIYTTPRTKIVERKLTDLRWRTLASYDFSLLDCNVSAFNSYNDHFLFDNRRLAQAYLDQCLASNS